MRWEDYRSSDNVEDRRGDDTSGGGGGGGGFGPLVAGGGGLGIGVVIIVFIVSQFTGIDFRTLLGGAEMVTGSGQGMTQQQVAPQRTPARQPAANDRSAQFVSKVLAETEDTWSKVLPQQKGIQYQRPKLVLYSGQTDAGGCGQAESAMGPFYCPLDRTVYLDMSFFREMQQRLGGGGEFAYAYVISHEIGHHVQNLLGILPKVQRLQQQASTRAEGSGLSVRTELQADCLAGVWASNANKDFHILQAGDVDKAVATAEAIGDDRLQRTSGRTVVPDSFTHGSSAQREKWLKTGLSTGQIDSCNTFTR